MTRASASSKTPRGAEAARARDDGFTLVFFALAVVALMGIAALVVDLGYWYLHANRIQRAADSAALAGVTYLPGDLPTATAVADSVAASNGFPSGVKVTEVGQHELSVSITDPNVPTFFAKVFGLDSITETRSSTATYQPPVPLGSAENSIGTGTLDLGAGQPTNIWAAVEGYCTSKENGDEILSAFDATTFNGGADPNCTLTPPDPRTPSETANYEYNAAGYFYDIVTPTSTGTLSQPLTVQAFDPGYNPTGCTSGAMTPDGTGPLPGRHITTYFNLTYAPVPPNHGLDQPVPGITAPYVAGTEDQTSCGQWVTMFTIPAGQPNGTYRLEVYTQAGEQDSSGTNAFGLRVYEGPAFARCSTISTDPTITWYSAACPVIQGEKFLPVYVNSAATTGAFYLANVDPTYDGHKMEINLFDPGEGAHYIQILDPNGNPVPFSYTTTDACSSVTPVFPPPPNQTSTDCAGPGGIPFPQATISGNSISPAGGPADVIDTSGKITPPTGIVSASIYNDRHLQLTVTIPANSPGGWWSVKYYANVGVSDRTTWSVSLLGSPIHLVQP